MAFNAEEIIKGITWEKFDGLTKPKLIKLSQHLDLELDQVMRKQEIKNFVIDALVDEHSFEESYLDKKVEIQAGTDSDVVKLKQLGFQRELDIMKLQLEKEKLQIEEQERKEKLDLEKALKQQKLDAKLQITKATRVRCKRKKDKIG